MMNEPDTIQINLIKDRFWWLMRLDEEKRSEFLDGYLSGVSEAFNVLGAMEMLQIKEEVASSEDQLTNFGQSQ